MKLEKIIKNSLLLLILGSFLLPGCQSDHKGYNEIERGAIESTKVLGEILSFLYPPKEPNSVKTYNPEK